MYLDLEEAWRAVRIADVADPSTLSKAIVIVNLKGVSLRHLWYLSLIKGFAKIGVDYFPEITRNVYMINAPTVTGLARNTCLSSWFPNS